MLCVHSLTFIYTHCCLHTLVVFFKFNLSLLYILVFRCEGCVPQEVQGQGRKQLGEPRQLCAQARQVHAHRDRLRPRGGGRRQARRKYFVNACACVRAARVRVHVYVPCACCMCACICTCMCVRACVYACVCTYVHTFMTCIN